MPPLLAKAVATHIATVLNIKSQSNQAAHIANSIIAEEPSSYDVPTVRNNVETHAFDIPTRDWESGVDIGLQRGWLIE